MSEFKVGDTVQWGYRPTVWGKVTKVTGAGTLTVFCGNGRDPVTFRRSKYGYNCRHVPAHELALDAWLKQKPVTKLLDVCRPFGHYHQDELDISMDRGALTVEVIHQLETEIAELRTWLAVKPVETEKPE